MRSRKSGLPLATRARKPGSGSSAFRGRYREWLGPKIFLVKIFQSLFGNQFSSSFKQSCLFWAENIFLVFRSWYLVKNFWYNNYVNAVKHYCLRIRVKMDENYAFQDFRNTFFRWEIRQNCLQPDRSRNRILKPDIRPEPDSAGYPVGS